jgi:galactokinase
MVAVALALVDVNQIALDERWRQAVGSAEDMAAYFASIENGQSFGRLTGGQGVGTAGGSEDHTAILCSTAGSLGQFKFCPTRRERSVALPGDLTFIVGCSGIAARKTGEALAQYNRASRAAGRLLSLWCHATGRSDRSLADALASAPEASARIRAEAAQARDEEFSATDLTERLDHFIEESEVLVPQASESLARGDTGRLSEIAARSQHIAEHWLRNQVPQTVALARTARECGAIAASAFGAGFGGSVWALVERSRARTVIERWSRAYAEAFPDAAARATFFVTRPGPAALDVDRA